MQLSIIYIKSCLIIIYDKEIFVIFSKCLVASSTIQFCKIQYKPIWQSAIEVDPAVDTLLSGQDEHSVAASPLYVLAPHSTHPLSVM